MIDSNKDIIWKDVFGFPNYECSTNGDYRNKVTGKVLGGSCVHNGYKHIGLVKDGKQVWKLHHRLIAETFLVKPSPEHNIVNHKNHIRTDNMASNLEWVTRSYNAKHKRNNTPRCALCNQPTYNIAPPPLRKSITVKKWKSACGVASEQGTPLGKF